MAKITSEGRISEIEGRKVKIDVKDQKILALLADESRLSIAQLAKKTGLGRDTVKYRIDRLVKEGILLGFIPIINLDAFGYPTYHVFMTINEINLDRKRELLRILKEHANTKSLMEYSDRWDLEWVLVAQNLQEFDQILTNITSQFSDVIVDKLNIEIIKGYKSVHLPHKFMKDLGVSGLEPIHPGKRIAYRPDRKDLDIIKLLAQDARMPLYKIARDTDLSIDTVRKRIKNLLDSDIIRKFTIIPNLSALDYIWHTMCINVKTFDHSSESKFRTFVTDHAYISRAVKVFGDWDLMLYIAADSIKNFHIAVKEIQETFNNIIIHYETYLAYKEHTYIALPKVVTLSG